LDPFKIQGRFKFEFIPEFVNSNPLGEFEVGPKGKVVPGASKIFPTKFSEFWTKGRSLFRISKFRRLKSLENYSKNLNGAGPTCQSVLKH
jgi:hypothetical protein